MNDVASAHSGYGVEYDDRAKAIQSRGKTAILSVSLSGLDILQLEYAKIYGK